MFENLEKQDQTPIEEKIVNQIEGKIRILIEKRIEEKFSIINPKNEQVLDKLQMIKANEIIAQIVEEFHDSLFQQIKKKKHIKSSSKYSEKLKKWSKLEKSLAYTKNNKKELTKEQ